MKVRFIFDDIEEALLAIDTYRDLYEKENVYRNHSLFITKHNRYLISFDIA